MSKYIVNLQDRKSNSLYPISLARAIKNQGTGNLENAVNENQPVLIGDISLGDIDMSNSQFLSSPDSSMITMKSAITIPYSGVAFNVVCPDNIQVRMFYGNSENASSINTYASKNVTPWMTSKESFIFPLDGSNIPDSNIWYYRLQFAYTEDSSVLDISTFNSLTKSGDLAVYYKDPTGGVIKRNSKALEAISASATYFDSDVKDANGIVVGRIRNTNFIHISDLHGNAYALDNALKLATYIQSAGILLTGDIVAQCYYDGYGFVSEIAKNYNVPVFICTGNHDGVGVDSHSEFNTDFIKPLADLYDYKWESGQGYYYKDIDDVSIRVISLDCCDSDAGYRISSIGADQQTWFENTINATPTGYGVIVLDHERLDCVSSDSSTKYPEFVDFPSDTARSAIDASTFILNTIDNFINNGGEYILNCSGHNHNDHTGLIADSSNPQLLSNISCSALNFDMQNGFSSRFDGHGNGSDLMNVYSINRYTGKVRIIRVGTNTTDRLTEKLVEEIPYKK